ncbi:MAG: bifunctional methylenetetrahydrofolate dehydrogenase/methenyltetrahydrofolate cyclohydrolase FolD [Micavibrio sp.]|nr:bifunctional methylenetetrahydrofolate dehydrogenase/methenyltetrahydrofolate cyclohydrolase FolD [Micavibrio sp.]|tara:strand:+ start:2962 stop:3801 length:840 start_codon:yes stop_codon:yes gene_type:complete
MSTLIDGKAVAAKLKEQLANEVSSMSKKPGLAVILVGDDPASHVYVRNKIKACEAVGIQSYETRLPEDATQQDVEEAITAFNNNADVNGILLQLPVPKHLDSDALVQMIDPAKDVDGLSFINQGKLVAGDKSGLVPCTPQGSLMLIKEIEQDLSGKSAVVIGRSLLFGKPMAQLLLAENCTITTAHSRTQNLEEVCKQADILVAAVGRAKMVKASWVKDGAIVIDVGINRQDDGKLCGDVDFDEVKDVAGAITPVPGGVGPMTIACLLANTVQAAKNQH